MERCTYPKGATVIEQGENGDFFYIVLNGKLDVYKDDKFLVYTYGAGVYQLLH
jgi:CRP-like cAMP-binding protein